MRTPFSESMTRLQRNKQFIPRRGHPQARPHNKSRRATSIIMDMEGCVTVKASVVLWEHTSHVIANNLSVSSPVLNPQHSCHKHSKQV